MNEWCQRHSNFSHVYPTTTTRRTTLNSSADSAAAKLTTQEVSECMDKFIQLDVVKLVWAHFVEIFSDRRRRKHGTLVTGACIFAVYYCFHMLLLLHTLYRLRVFSGRTAPAQSPAVGSQIRTRSRLNAGDWMFQTSFIAFDMCSLILAVARFIAFGFRDFPELNIFCLRSVGGRQWVLALGNVSLYGIYIFLIANPTLLIFSAMRPIRHLLMIDSDRSGGQQQGTIGGRNHQNQQQSNGDNNNKSGRLPEGWFYPACIVFSVLLGVLASHSACIERAGLLQFPLAASSQLENRSISDDFEIMRHFPIPETLADGVCFRRHTFIDRFCHRRPKGGHETEIAAAAKDWLFRKTNSKSNSSSFCSIRRVDGQDNRYFQPIYMGTTIGMIAASGGLVFLLCFRKGAGRKLRGFQIVIVSILVEAGVTAVLPSLYAVHFLLLPSNVQKTWKTVMAALMRAAYVLQIAVTPAIRIILSGSFRREYLGMFRWIPLSSQEYEGLHLIFVIIFTYLIGLLLTVYVPYRLVYRNGGS